MRSELDEIDKKIIQALTDNARIPEGDLSRLVNLPRNAVAHRIQRLEKTHIINGYQVILGDGSSVNDAVVAIMIVHRKDRMLVPRSSSMLRKCRRGYLARL